MGGVAAGIFGSEALGGLGGVTFMSQLVGSLVGAVFALIAGFLIYGGLKIAIGIRLSEERNSTAPTVRSTRSALIRKPIWATDHLTNACKSCRRLFRGRGGGMRSDLNGAQSGVAIAFGLIPGIRASLAPARFVPGGIETMPSGIRDKVAILGMGCSKFGERWDCDAEDLMMEAYEECLKDAGIETSQIDAAWFSTAIEEVHVGKSGVPLATALRLPYIPVTRVENMCASGTEAFRGAVYAVASGAADIALAVGVEKLKDTGYGGLPQNVAVAR